MRVTHKILDSGYHHVRALGYTHLFAQWPKGSPVTSNDVSYGECHPGADVVREFCEAAQEAAASERSNCDVCDERPWTHQGVVTGIETYYCCQCGNHEPCEE